MERMQQAHEHDSSSTKAAGRSAPANAEPRGVTQKVATMSLNGSTLQRKPGCACGGACPRCQAAKGMQAHTVQPKLTVNAPGDAFEQEADRVADHVMRMPAPGGATPASEAPGVAASSGTAPHVQRACAACGGGASQVEEEEGMMQAKESPGGTPRVSDATAGRISSMRGGGEPLDRSVREHLEPRFGHDFGNVRIHRDAGAAQAAREVNARAFTVGGDIAFASGEYSPATTSGMHLLAHELTHTIQQGASVQRSGWTSTSTASPAIQRTRAEGIQRAPTISVMDENFVGPPTTSQRRAEKSCPINCCHTKLGTLHAMPLFYSVSRGSIVAAGSASATGVGAALHFIKEAAQPPARDVCHCDDMRMIQIVTSNVPSDPRGNNSFVDNGDVGTSPFYGDTGLTGRGEHTIDPRFVDAGERIKTDESIYDIPFRDPAILGTTDFSWMAETCVACIKNTGPDRILGCVTYGFTRHYNTATSSFDPIVAVSPSCQNTSTASFRNTLRTDPTTTAYDFEGAPGPIECGDAGDFPAPRGDTRYA